LRFCIPWVRGRGAGLGNELFPWSKAFLASAELGLKLLHPAWGLNRRRYWTHFDTSRADWVVHRVLEHSLPRYHFSEADYRATGEDDFGRAVALWAADLKLTNKKAYVLLIDGMWGGFYSIQRARPFVYQQLLASRYALRNINAMSKRRDPWRLLVAVHIRRGDFRIAGAESTSESRFNLVIPEGWYEKVCRSLREGLGRLVQFALFSDANKEDLAAFIKEFDPITSTDLPHTECSDLLTMASADLLVCSASTYSMWGACLSEAPYIWYAPQLYEEDGFVSLWGNEGAQRASGGLTRRHKAELLNSDGQLIAADICPRGAPVGEDGVIPTYVLSLLKSRVSTRRPVTDLIMYGVVPSTDNQTARIKLKSTL